MTAEPSSPRRRHILSSINPDTRSPSPRIEEPSEAPRAQGSQGFHDDEQPKTEPTVEAAPRKTSKFRFKSRSSRSHRSSRHGDRRHSLDANSERDESTSRRRHKHRHRHHRHEKRHTRPRSRSRSRSPTPPNPYEPPPLDAEAAFRESLFDAMADDEGAAYWEGVYGQPIHVYSQERAGPEGELERMNDEEYAAYVRQKMWEKTHQGLLEERARREEMRRQKDRDAEEAARLTKEMERSLRKGEERRMKKSWRERWNTYTGAWDAWDGSLEGITWPVRSGRREDIDAAAIREFYVMAIDPVEVGEVTFLAKLKDERVRWHPDKIQQRLGGKVDDAVMRQVTAVFQVVDKLWTDTRSKRNVGAQ
ncbi:hypothetical protein GGR50DRAFT_503948 [Xylaria sp. CBS 124048]|nr:hypothetical protein GGR50DRAFT_503948 [Xylaria sp. CBS 124048]